MTDRDNRPGGFSPAAFRAEQRGADPVTPATELRAAAKLMREHAEKIAPGPWAWEMTGEKDSSWAVGFVQDEAGNTLSGQLEHGKGIVIDGVCEGLAGCTAYRPAAEHVASWHPAVALAVADWLEREAALIDAQVFPQSDPVMERYPLAVARAYLGERPDA